MNLNVITLQYSQPPVHTNTHLCVISPFFPCSKNIVFKSNQSLSLLSLLYSNMLFPPTCWTTTEFFQYFWEEMEKKLSNFSHYFREMCDSQIVLSLVQGAVKFTLSFSWSPYCMVPLSFIAVFMKNPVITEHNWTDFYCIAMPQKCSLDKNDILTVMTFRAQVSISACYISYC